jgi:tetratricopeptide (TPR) repeat protein
VGYLDFEKIKNIDEYRSNAGFYFRTGMRYISKNKPLQALGFLLKAVENEPYNADYQFNLACVYAELKNTKQSSKTLLNIIKNIDPTIPECYFGIACNYFESGKFDKAREYFEKYIEVDESGEFSDESYEVLYYMELFEEGKSRPNRDKTISKLINEGRALMDAREYKKACSKFDKAVEIEPMAIFPRSNLSLACFFNGDVQRAISVAESILRLDSENLTANISLLMYYAYLNNSVLFKKQVRNLYGLKTNNKEGYISEAKQFFNMIRGNERVDKSLEGLIINILKTKENEIDIVTSDKNLPINLVNFEAKNKNH